MKSVFEFNDYREFLRYWASLERGRVATMAKVANCQASYISRAMSEEVHITPDHAFLLGKHFGFRSYELEYFRNLVEKERAATIDLREFILEKLNQLKSEHLQVKTHVQRRTPLEMESDSFYHSHWAVLAVHATTDIKTLQTPALIAQNLGLSIEFVEHILKELTDRQLVARQLDGTYIYSSEPSHLPKNSPWINLFLQNWRLKALMQAPLQRPESIHFSNVQTIDPETYEQIRNQLMDFIKKSSQAATASKPKELMVLNCDFFKMS
jgi:uncharacterized protein (TIGR02147 family)